MTNAARTLMTMLAASWAILLPGCNLSPPTDLDAQVDAISRPYQFSLLAWETKALLNEIRSRPRPTEGIDHVGAATVEQYLHLLELTQSQQEPRAHDLQILEDRTERILAWQIEAELLQEQIASPLYRVLRLRFIFPPVRLEIEQPPQLLVMSPRDKIELLRRTTLRQDLSPGDRDMIESKVDALGVSSLVVRLGGLGATYPTMVAESTDLGWLIDTAVEEWFHQYMAFKPLGFLYLLDALGIRADYDVVTMNETAAGIVSHEIGARIRQKYYAAPADAPNSPGTDDDFNQQMRRIRIDVDRYLAQGSVAAAEQYMQQKRDFLATRGYHIRRLNQAYFAFYGTYADEPTAVSPIGRDLKELRDRSPSLRAFLQQVAQMTRYRDLEQALEEAR